VSYGAMIVCSFLFAEKHYKVNYEIYKMAPYFIIAITMTIFAYYFNYKNIIAEFVINTLLMLVFIGYAQYKDRFLTLIFSKDENKNS
jgi:hypothetical protein